MNVKSGFTVRFKVKIKSTQVFIFTSSKWSASNIAKKPELRAKLRTTAQKTADKLYCPHISISHTSTYGGFAVCKYPVGFDLEVADRPISARAYKRLTSQNERKLNLMPIQAWVIKEAAWKALRGPHQPKTVTQIKIISIKKKPKLQQQGFLFKACHFKMLNQPNPGLILIHNRLIMGIAIHRP